MGKLNLVIRDDLDEKFREAVYKRKGLKKGNLTDAIEEALELWIDSDILKELEETATSKINTPITHDRAIETIGKMGRIALPSLSRISHNPDCTVLSRDHALKLISDILEQR